MKHFRLLFTTLLLLCAVSVSAHDFEVDGIYYDIISASDLTAKVTYKGDSYDEISNEYSGEVIIPETVVYKSKVLKVTSIGRSAFSDCSGLTSIEIPNSVTSFGHYAFSACRGLTNVTIPNSVTSIGNSAFSACRGLTNVTIGNSVKSIGGFAFSACSSLTNVTIPNSVTTIEDYAFYDCSILKTVVNLSNLKINNGSEVYGYVGYYADKVINAPNGTIEGDFVFGKVNGNNTLCGYIGNDIELSLPNNYKGENYVIGGYAFSGCSSLTNVTIGNSVTSIEGSAFSGCSSLTNVTIGNSVTSIGDYAFHGCTGLTSINLLGKTPPTVGSSNFTEAQYTDITLFVPKGSLETYQAADTWKNFWDIREEGTTETPDEEVKKCATPVITYKNSGLDITTETDGAEIHTDITCSDANSYNGDRIDLSATYSITTHATKSGYLNSDTATATLCWIAVSSSSEENSIIEVEAMPVLITCNNGTINISGGKDGAEVVIYTTSGVAVGNATITNGNASISTELAMGEIAVVNIAGKGIKIVMQ